MLLDLAAVHLHIPGQLGIGSDRRLRWFAGLMAVEACLYLCAVLLVLRVELPRRAVFGILLFAAAMRGIVLGTPPFLSTDIHRYVWDGIVQNAGINPYRYRPDAPELAFLRTPAIYPGINRKDTARTIYPPAAESIFALIARVSPTILGMRLAMTGFDVLGILALLALLRSAGRPASWSLIYAWHPLPIWEFAGNGHVDAIVVGFMALALLAAARLRPFLASAAFTGAVLAKFLPVALLASLWRPRDWRFPALFLLLTVILYARYVDVGLHVFGFLHGYVRQEGVASGSGIFWLRVGDWFWKLPSFTGTVYLGIAGLVFAGVSLRIWCRKLPQDQTHRTRVFVADAALLTMMLLFVLTPHYAWYFTWMIVLLCVVPSMAGLYLTASAFLLYLDPVHTKLLWPGLVFLPSLLLAGLTFIPRLARIAMRHE